MAKDRLSGKLAVILHADIAGSTSLVQQDEQLAHERIQDAFRRFTETIQTYQGHILELRGDALLAEFENRLTDRLCVNQQLHRIIYRVIIHACGYAHQVFPICPDHENASCLSCPGHSV